MDSERTKVRQIWILGWVSFFNDLSSEVISRVVPLFLLTVVKTSFLGVGIIEAISDATATLGRLFAGTYSDRHRRKPLVFAGYLLSVLSRPLILLNPSLAFVGGARFLEKLGKSVRTPPRDALIADLSTTTTRGKSFGINRALDTAGAVMGVVAVYLYLQWHPTSDGVALRQILIGACAAGILALFVLGLVKEPAQEKVVKKPVFIPSLSLLSPALRSYLSIALLFGLASSSDAFIVVRARSLDFSLGQIFLILAGFNLVSAVTAYSLSSLSDRLGRKRLLMGGWFVYAVAYGLYGLPSLSRGLFLLTILFYGLFYALTDGIEKALVADLEEHGSKGQAYGWLGLVQGLAVIPANLVFAWTYQTYGAPWAFWTSAFFAFMGIVLLSAWPRL